MPDGSIKELASVDEARSYRSQNFPAYKSGGAQLNTDNQDLISTSSELTPRAKQLYEFYQRINPTTEEGRQIADAVRKKIDLEMKLNPVKKTDIIRERAQRNVDKLEIDINDIFKILNNVPSGEGWRAIPSGAFQEIKQLVKENADLEEYESATKVLAGPVAKSVAGESGRLTDQDIERAMSIFPSSFSSTEERKRKIDRINKIIGSARDKNIDPFDFQVVGKDDADQMNDEDNDDIQAINWAMQNPDDPRAKKILELHGR